MTGSEMTGIGISHNETNGKGRYEARIKGQAEIGQLTYSRVTETLIIADHTFVPASLRGHGLAQALVTRLIADARKQGERIVALCPFVRAHAQKHREELADVIQW